MEPRALQMLSKMLYTELYIPSPHPTFSIKFLVFFRRRSLRQDLANAGWSQTS
jgi:hypothetical protein